MIHVNVVLSSRVWYQQQNLSQPSQQDPPPCPSPTSTSAKYKAWVHKFHLSSDFTSLWPFCFIQYFPGWLFSFSSWNYFGKTGKISEVWIFWWEHLSSREFSSREFTERGFTGKTTQMCGFRHHSCEKTSWHPHSSGLLSPLVHGSQRNGPAHGSRVSLLNFTLGITLN